MLRRKIWQIGRCYVKEKDLIVFQSSYENGEKEFAKEILSQTEGSQKHDVTAQCRCLKHTRKVTGMSK